MTFDEFNKYLKNMTKEVQDAIRKDLPKIIGNKAVHLFKHNFQTESFFGKKWREVKRRLKNTKGAAGKRKILTGPTGNLGRSIRAQPSDASVTIISDLPYSDAHNDGTTTAGRGHKTTIPQRQFIGDDPQLQKEIDKRIRKSLDRIIKRK